MIGPDDTRQWDEMARHPQVFPDAHPTGSAGHVTGDATPVRFAGDRAREVSHERDGT